MRTDSQFRGDRQLIKGGRMIIAKMAQTVPTYFDVWRFLILKTNFSETKNVSSTPDLREAGHRQLPYLTVKTTCDNKEILTRKLLNRKKRNQNKHKKALSSQE